MTPLEQLIKERIQREGPITFASYMHSALYDPHHGYYVSGPARMGWEGKDYFTSSDVSPLFAHCLGRQLLAMWHQLAQPDPFIVIEQGAGRGELGRTLQRWAQQQHPDLFRALHYHNEDIKTGHDALRRDGIHDALPPNQLANEHAGLYGPHSLRPTPAHAHVLLSNELIDAFAVHIIEIREKKLYEVFVDVHNGRLREILMEPSTPRLMDYLEQYRIPWHTFPDQWRTEINLHALSWMRNSVQRLFAPRTASTHQQRAVHSYLLTIDYGEKARNLYTLERRRGTLACYYKHQLNEQPLARPGEQDITAHVNFSALISEGRLQGLRLDTFTTQREWLERMGLYEELEQLRATEPALSESMRASDKGQIALLQWYNLRQRAAALTDLHGMGNFKVLIMKR